jgi:hypothetical protein
MAMPAMAVVTFSAADDNGVLVISYAGDPGDAPRGVALRISLSDGATAGPDDVMSVMAEFNTNIDFAASNPGNFNIGDGHPLADPAAAGAITEAASEFSVSMGVLDEAGNQAPAPESGELIRIDIHGNCTATICADTLRGPDSGVVGSVLESNLQDGCIEVAISDVVDCWDFPCQNVGDCNGDCFVDSVDLLVFVGAWTDYAGQTPEGIPHRCADTNEDGFVDSADILNLIEGWNNGCGECTPQ